MQLTEQSVAEAYMFVQNALVFTLSSLMRAIDYPLKNEFFKGF